MNKDTAPVRYILEIEMYSNEQPSNDQFIAAVQAAAKQLPGQCSEWGIHGICTQQHRTDQIITSTERR